MENEDNSFEEIQLHKMCGEKESGEAKVLPGKGVRTIG
jgi:hypothetical protein